MSQAIPKQELSFKPANGWWYVGMGNDTNRDEKLAVFKNESGKWKSVTNGTVRSHTIDSPSLVRVNRAIFGWNGTQKLKVEWYANSNNNLTTNVFLVTDINDGRLPYIGVPTSADNWGWK